MKRTLSQNKKLYKLLHITGMASLKNELILQYTHGRTEHSSEMTIDECTQLIKKLEELYEQKKESIQCDKLRKTIISLYRTIGYNIEGKADMIRIQEDVKNYWGKYLNDYNKEELIKIISVLKNKIVPFKLNSYE